ncbi:MAG: aminopeptidase [Desulfobacteraceae bacterium]|nr:aminopeptidase [Desulfobacteraceae bacterium]
MISDIQLDRYADVMLWGLKTARKERYRKNDIILIRYDLPAIKLAEVLQAKLLEMGMNPVLRMDFTSRMEQTFFEKSNSRQVVFQAPGERELLENLNGSIYLHSPESITHLSHIDPKKIGKAAVARKPLRDILWRREEQGVFGWTLCMLPTPELAKHAGLSMKQYALQVIKACYLDRVDPVKEWKKIFKGAISIKKWINSMDVRYYHIQSENIDLRIHPGQQRKWIGISGHNIPSFELFLSPDWRGTEGVYFANLPTYRSGNYVEAVRLEFRKGRVIKAEAKKGEDFVVKQISMDKGASGIGEFSLTDKRFSKINRFMANTLFDENFGGRQGNCHLALGSSYSDTFDGDPAKLTKEKKMKLGFNDSALHWDLVNTEKKRVTAHLASGGQIVIYEDGMFKAPLSI